MSLPILQAPMAGVQGVALALAVGRAGGIGSLPAAMMSSEPLVASLRQLDAAKAAYNVNFFAHTPREPDERLQRWADSLAAYREEFGVREVASMGSERRPFGEEALAAVTTASPTIVSFHFGLPAKPLLAELKRRLPDTFIASTATTVDEARWLEENGAQMVVAQGWEAGGHRGHFLSDDLSLHLPTRELVAAIRAAVRLPVIAAGGITTPAQVRAALAAGASAVQCGTAFLLADEAATPDLHRTAIEQPHETVVTTVMTGRPARGIPNRLIRDLGETPDDLPGYPHTAGPLAPLRAAAEARGRTDFTPLWCGANTDSVRRGAAEDIVARLMGEKI
ncbi:NAD(P)H-dependent flavin oxidoreductase [Tessaracoccus flavus]|uniref:Propionate 3-nitronate monooxygenase n=1 Tax=Tessaracoccus flavus TaxID=1610493 RepID=A0A1Q2CGH3_9ACTN|nr:nitronate monooxygenase [Tessaracoccus flavus]AQP45203.1 hypothetical protein RPIT_10685 [Tessaracoccus flavus]SDY53169.1 nitronate monooxygenase [Tessaracoccus flavus]